MKVVVNKCYGGFGLSKKALKMLRELKGKDTFFYKQIKYDFADGQNEYMKVNEYDGGKGFYDASDIDLGDYTNEIPNENYVSDCEYSEYKNRADSDLVKVVENLGDEANDSCSNLKIIEIPDDVNWTISEYDGHERVEEVHRSWY